MINTIEFLGADDGEDSSSDSSSDSNSEDSSTDSSSDSNFEDSSTDTSSDSNTNSSNDDSSGDVNTCEHKFGGWIVDVEPTETTDGSQHRTCRLCDFVEEEIIPALGDSSSDTGSSDEDSSDAPNVCEHDFSDWITVKEPTETTDGKAIRTCWICGDKEEKVLPATGSTSSDSSDDSGSDTSSESGADSNSDSSDLGSTSGGVSSSTTDDTVNSDNDEISNSDTAPIGQVGCGSSISIGVSLISFAVLVGCGLVFKKKKEE
jgi:clumping factor A